MKKNKLLLFYSFKLNKQTSKTWRRLCRSRRLKENSLEKGLRVFKAKRLNPFSINKEQTSDLFVSPVQIVKDEKIIINLRL